jgi:N-acetylmuramoyl-L-alanine amidase CwlA
MYDGNALSNDDVTEHVDEVHKYGQHHILREGRQWCIINFNTIGKVSNSSPMFTCMGENNDLQDSTTVQRRNFQFDERIS